MLKGKRNISACSLSSCRLRAEALARAFNTRIWPCVWISQKSNSEKDDGMSNGIDNEEEFFDASPSPVELEDESLFCQQHSSAATVACRAKLYELLQQHANDDAIDVFYDVGEEATSTDPACDTCLNVDAKNSDQILLESSENSVHIGDEMCFTSNSENNQSNDNPIKTQNSDESEINDARHQNAVSESDENCKSNTGNSHDENLSNETSSVSFQDLQELTETINAISDQITLNETDVEIKGNCVPYSNGIATEKDENNTDIEIKGSIDLPSSDACEVPVVKHKESFLIKEKHPRVFSESLLVDDIDKDVENEEVAPVQVTVDSGSPSDSSDTSETKPVSPPLSRLQIFEDPRPKIIRSTSLKTGKTPPGTPSRKKIVRFADVMGLDLEDVRHIMSGDLPVIPSSAYTDLNLTDADLQICEPISEKLEVNRRDPSNWQAVKRSSTTSNLYPLFSAPGELPDFWERLRFQGICLETVTVSEVNVQCTCRVVNYGYHKKVIARYTINDWLSYNDIDASYVLGSTNGDTDAFTFTIFLSPLIKNLKFALKYEVNGKEYWDNNRNQNYCFGYYSNDLMNLQSSPPLPSFQHEFW